MVKTDSYVQFEAGKLTYRVVPVTEEIIRMIVSGKEIKEAQDSLIIEKKEYPCENCESLCRDQHCIR